MQRLSPGWFGAALCALAMVAGIVPAAARPQPATKPAKVHVTLLKIVVCIRPMASQNCGPGRPRIRVASGVQTVTSGSIPYLAKVAGTVTVFRMPTGRKTFACPGRCSSSLPPKTRVKIQATPHQEPGANYTVDQIVGCKSSDLRTCQFILGGPTTVTVVFASGD